MLRKLGKMCIRDRIITDSKVNDAKKALALWDDFYKRNERDIDDAYFEKASGVGNHILCCVKQLSDKRS